MTEPNSVTIRQPTEGRTIGIVGDIYRFLATGEETGGRYAMFEAIVLPGGGPPPHVHRREDETFYVLEGEVTFQIGDERLVAGPGTFVNMPIGNPHAFKNETDQTAKMLISYAPAGLEDYFFEVGQAFGAATGCPPLVAHDATREAGKDRGQGGSSRGVCDVSTGRGGRSQQAVSADSRSDSSLANDGSESRTRVTIRCAPKQWTIRMGAGDRLR